MSKIKGPAMGRRTAAAIAAEIEALDAERAPAAAALARERAARPALVEAGDLDGIEALDAKVHRAEIKAEVHASRRARLAAEMEESSAAEAHAAEQAKRRATYDEARAAADEAARLYREEYPRLARAIAELLGRTYRAEGLVKAANAARPDGAEPIPLDFEPSRGKPWTEGRYVEQFKTVRYDTRTREPVHAYTPGDPFIAEQRVPAGRTWEPGQQGTPHIALRDEVRLPGVAFGDPAHWPPAVVVPFHEHPKHRGQ